MADDDALKQNSRIIRQARLSDVDQWGKIVGTIVMLLPMVSRDVPQPVMYVGLAIIGILVLTTMRRNRLIRKFRTEDHKSGKNRKPMDI